MKFINKKMTIVINKLATKLSGGASLSGNNIRQGQSLAFIENIHVNSFFGEKIYPDIFHQAAAYMFHIIKNHVFIDGNKRTGLAVSITFLQWNGIRFSPLNEDKVFDFVISIAEGENNPDLVIPKIAAWFKELSIEK